MAELTILGVGNILMRDDGVGVSLMEALRDQGGWDGRVELVDGGVGGLNLLGIIERSSRLVVIDAADMHLPPGAARVVEVEQIAGPDAPSDLLSLHQLPLVDTLRLCREFLHCPPTVIFAIQPARVEHGRQLSDELMAALADLTRQAADLVRAELDRPRTPSQAETS